MCLICRKFKANKITSAETLNFASAMHYTGHVDHAAEIVELVMQKEVPMPETDPDMDAIYERELKG